MKFSLILIGFLALNFAHADTQEECKRFNAALMKHISEGASVSGSSSKFAVECTDVGNNNFVGKITKDELDSLTLAQASKIMKSVKDCMAQESGSSGTNGNSGSVSAKVKGRAIASASESGCAKVFNLIQYRIADKAGVGSENNNPCAKDESAGGVVKTSGGAYRPKPVPILEGKNGVMGPLVNCSHYTGKIPCPLCERAGGTCY